MGTEWIVLGAAVGALLAGVASAAFGASRKGARWQDEIEAAWRAAADAHDWRLEVSGRGRLEPRELRLFADVDEVDVVLETKVPVDPATHGFTRASCAYALGEGPSFAAEEAGPEGPAMRGSRLRSSEPSVVRAALSADATERIGQFPRPIARLGSDGRRVELAWPGAERHEEILERAARLVGAIATSGTEVLPALASLEGASYEARSPGGGGPRIRVRRGGAEVILEARFAPAGPRVRASAEARRAPPPFEATIGEDGTVAGELPDGVLDPAVAGELPRVGPVSFVGEGERLVLAWAGVPSEAQAEAAVRILAAVAAGTGQQGAFR